MPNPAIQSLGDYIQPDLPCLVLSGAGCSTGSGLGDYRDKHGRWKRPQPMTGQQFLASESSRKRYWARSFTGWPLFNAAKPNACHTALVQMQQLGLTTRLVTQNVDGLHQQAGHREVIDLHGRLDRVLCTDCGLRQARQSFQQQLLRNNPPLADLTADAAPDGDADLSQTTFDWLRLPACPDCGGVIKPDVVFFGENVPRQRVEMAMSALEESSALLVTGSSLMVYSGYRFARAAHAQGKPVLIINRGTTRADDLATIKINDDCSSALQAVIKQHADSHLRPAGQSS